MFSSKGEKVVLPYFIFNENVTAVEAFKRKMERKRIIYWEFLNPS